MKCKECETETSDNHNAYCDECLKKFSNVHAEAKEERQQNKIQCKICKKYFILLASHTFAIHGLTGKEYRKMFGYDIKKGLIPEHYRQARQAQNKKNCAYENLKGKGAPPFKKGHKCDYERSPETIGRLTKQFDDVVVTEETKKKLSKTRKGRRHSEETKKKMSAARKKYWALRHRL